MARMPKRMEILPGVFMDVTDDESRAGVVVLKGPVTIDGFEINLLEVIPDPDPGTPKATMAESLDERIGRGA